VQEMVDSGILSVDSTLMTAASMGSLPLLEQMIELGADPNDGLDGDHAIIGAAINGYDWLSSTLSPSHEAVVRRLIRHENILSEDVLLAGCVMGLTDVVEKVLDNNTGLSVGQLVLSCLALSMCVCVRVYL
jgi:hypothetical protein